jgi:LigD, primase-polymerase domain
VRKGFGHAEQDGAGDVFDRPYPPCRVTFRQPAEQACLTVGAKPVPGAGVDRAGEMALTRTGANSTASDRPSVSATPLVIAIGDRIVRALRERPCMLHRFPSGVDGDKVHQKRVPSGSLQPPVADQPLQRCTSTASTAPVARCWG